MSATDLTTPTLGDEAATEAFAERIFASLLGAFDTLTVALGDQLGLYEALHRHGPLTPAQLGQQAGIDARYAREWLEQQTVAGLLAVQDADLPAEQRRFFVPAAHVPVLVDEDDLGFLRPVLTCAAAAGRQFDALLTAYRTGGGVPWRAYGELMRSAQARANRPLFLRVLGQQWLPSIGDVHARLLAGGRVADIGCGDGWSSIGMALAYPGVTVDGFDVDLDSVRAANENAAAYGVGDRVRVFAVDGATVNRPGRYDLVTAFECVHDMNDPVSVLAEMRELVTADGAVLVVDERVPERFTGPGDPMEALFYGYSTVICLPDGLAHERSVATGTVMRPDVLRGYAQAAGFRDVDVLPIEHETFRVYRLVP